MKPRIYIGFASIVGVILIIIMLNSINKAAYDAAGPHLSTNGEPGVDTTSGTKGKLDTTILHDNP